MSDWGRERENQGGGGILFQFGQYKSKSPVSCIYNTLLLTTGAISSVLERRTYVSLFK